MELDAVVFDWGGTLTPWHSVDFAAEAQALALAALDAHPVWFARWCASGAWGGGASSASASACASAAKSTVCQGVSVPPQSKTTASSTPTPSPACRGRRR